MNTLKISLAQNEYPIYFGSGLMQKSGEIINYIYKEGMAAVVTDSNVYALYGDSLKISLLSGGIQPFFIILRPGESSKSIETLTSIYNSLYENKLSRNRPVIAFGGGVVGDVAGFAAATFMRGVPLVQIPTTLLAQVDSSVGGKVAVDLPYAKNMVGAFYHPRVVLSDHETLKTLNLRDLSSGMAEVIKYAALEGGEILQMVENYSINSPETENLIYKCCEIKKKYVIEDEKDTGVRMMLNFGHSFAHAIEKLGGYSQYTHGEAVAIGMFMAAKTGYVLGITGKECVFTIKKLLTKWNLPTKSDFACEVITENMLQDKKNTDNMINLVLIEEFGKPLLKQVDSGEIIHALKITEGV